MHWRQCCPSGPQFAQPGLTGLPSVSRGPQSAPQEQGIQLDKATNVFKGTGVDGVSLSIQERININEQVYVVHFTNCT